MRRYLAFSALLGLAGCAYPSPQHVKELNALVGKPEPDLLRSYGVPTRVYDTSGLRFLSYQMSRIDSFPGDGFGYGGFGGYGGYGGFGYGGFGYGGGLGYGGFGGFGPEIIQRDCTTTFELQNHIVKSYSLRGNDC